MLKLNFNDKISYYENNIYYFYLISLCIDLDMCLMGDVDKVKPYYKLEDQTAIRNAQSAEQVLRGVYTQWRAWDLCNFRSHIGLLAGSLALSGSGGLAGETGFTDNKYWKTIVSSEMSIIIYMM